jgi:hypothetical protein
MTGALESGCDYIVTFNTRDFAGLERFDYLDHQPQEFLREL